MTALTCGRPGCRNTAAPVRVNGLLTDPPGWSGITITGQPITHRLLCPPCTGEARALLDTSPVAAELARDAALEDAFARGYAEGADDVRARTNAEASS